MKYEKIISENIVEDLTNTYLNELKLAFKDREAVTIGNIGAAFLRESIMFRENLPNSIVHTFEMRKKQYWDMYHQNKDSKIKLYNYCVTNKEDDIQYYSSGNSSSILFSKRKRFERKKRKWAKAITLDKWCNDNKVTFDALWVDVEGTQKEFFEGASQTLKNIEILYIETEDIPMWENQLLTDDIIDYLKPYELHFFKADALTGVKQRNIIFKRNI